MSRKMSIKENTCPLSLNNNCVPMACSCGSVNVELCRNLFRAYALGYREATARKNAELKEMPTETPEILKEKININALDACPEIETNPVPLVTKHG